MFAILVGWAFFWIMLFSFLIALGVFSEPRNQSYIRGGILGAAVNFVLLIALGVGGALGGWFGFFIGWGIFWLFFWILFVVAVLTATKLDNNENRELAVGTGAMLGAVSVAYLFAVMIAGLVV